MATLMVTTAGDSGFGSLRQAVSDANATAEADTIVFDPGLAGATITLTGGELALTSDITIDGDVDGDNRADITISGNNASRIFYISGGGTDAGLLSLNITQGNSGGKSGGAIVADGAAPLLIRDSTISESFSSREGGGIRLSYTAATIANCLITGNLANYSGGGISATGSALTLQNTTVYANSAGGFGGGIAVDGGPYTSGTLALFNTTVSGNQAAAGSSATAYGGGLSIYNIVYSVLYNSVVAGNTSGSLQTSHDVSGTINFAGNNAFGTVDSIAIDGGGNLNGVTDVGLGSLADHGGTVQTLTLQQGSILIDAGSNTRIATDNTDLDDDGNTAEPLPVDADGGPRISGGTVDIGASEFNAPLVVTTADDVVDANDGVLSLREAVALANAGADADTITFDASLAGQSLGLVTGELVLTADITINGDIDGDRKADITISGGDLSRIFNISGAATDASLVSLTLANGYSDVGGAIFANGTSSLQITDSTIKNSQATMTGGAVELETAGNFELTNSTLSGNIAVGLGGGIYMFGSTASIVNSTIHGNSSQSAGGGLSTGSASITLINSTVTGNHAGTAGGAIDNINSTITVINSVVAENAADGNAATGDVSGTIATATNSVFGSAVTVTASNNVHQSVTDIGLGALQDNGGPVMTRGIQTAASPLVDTGSNDGLPLGLTTDADGQSRIGNGTVDIGATEFNGTLVVTTASDKVDGSDGVLSLREAIAIAEAQGGPDTIVFDASLAGQTLVLTGGELSLQSDISIDGDVNGDNRADITISGNNASRIFNISGQNTAVSLASLTLTNGTAGRGGAIYLFRAESLRISDTTFQGNTATARGGALYSNLTNVYLTNTTFTGCSAGTSGGALHFQHGTATLTNTTLHGNQAQTIGGAIFGYYATINLASSTVTSNSAKYGGGIYGYGSQVTVTNSVVAENTAATAGSDVLGNIAFATNSVFGSDITALYFTNLQEQVSNIGLGALQDNGGTVATRNILDGSPLLNAGSNAGVPGGLTQDANGALRIFGGTVDIGATELQDQAPVITSNGSGATASISLAENGTAVTTVTSSDPDAGATKLFTISGADAALFAINSATGVLTFKSAPNFEAPADTGANNVYDVTVKVTDGTLTDTQAIAVTVTNQNEAPVITSNGGGATASISIAENGTAVTTVAVSDPDAGATKTFSLSGADAARFAINSATGALTFLAAPDFETPADHGGDNVYDVTVLVTDGALSDSQDIAVTVTNLAGVVITGTAKADTVTSTKTVAGQPLPTGEEDRINGRGGDDILNGLGGNDRLKGGANDDTLKGGAGADRLGGGSGADLLVGGSGNDVMTGDAGTDRLKGGSGDDRLIGGKGIDKLAGNGGADTFVLTNKAADHDVISGFVHAADSLEISAAKFGGGLTAGHALAAKAFVSNATGEAGDANDRFIFDTATKELFFDADGTGSTAAILIATFTGPNPHLGADDVLIV